MLVEAALGVFGELYKAVKSIKDKNDTFKTTFDSLESTLKSIEPVIKEMELQNKNLGRPKEELDSLIRGMKAGTKLVKKCSKIRSKKRNTIDRARYCKELEKLENFLLRFFQFDLQAHMARDQKEILNKMNRLQSSINKFSNPQSGDQQIDIEGMDSSSIQEKMQDQQPPSATTVIGTQYCDPSPNLLEIVRTVKPLSSEKFSVKNINGDTIFNLEKPFFSGHGRYALFDDGENPIVTLRKKKMTMHNRWEVFRDQTLLFSVKQHHIIQLGGKFDVFLSKNKKEEVCDFMVKDF